MLVVPDVDDVFLPATSGLLVNPAEHRYARCSSLRRSHEYRVSRDAITNLLTALPSRHEQSFETEAALGSVLSAGLAALVSVSP